MIRSRPRSTIGFDDRRMCPQSMQIDVHVKILCRILVELASTFARTEHLEVFRQANLQTARRPLRTRSTITTLVASVAWQGYVFEF